MDNSSNRKIFRNTLLIFAIIDIFCILVGAMFRLNHWSGGAPMLIPGMGVAIWVWLGVLTYRCIVGYDTTMPSSYSAFRIIAHIMLAISGSFLIWGSLSAINHWPGWELFTAIGLVTTSISIIAMVIVFIRKEIHNKKQNNNLQN